MNDLISFSFDSHSVRTASALGDIWFVLADVLEAFGSKRSVFSAKRSIIENLGGGALNEIPIVDGLGRPQNTVIINENAVTFCYPEAGRKAEDA